MRDQGGLSLNIYRCGAFGALDPEECFAFLEQHYDDFHWSRDVFLQRLHRGLLFVLTIQLNNENRIAAILLAQCVVSDLDIEMVVVDASLRGQGVATHMMQAVLSSHQKESFNRVFLEVRASNAPAIALYKKMGFEIGRVRRGYYPATPDKPKEDALEMFKCMDV